jgi:hypothetical protein
LTKVRVILYFFLLLISACSKIENNSPKLYVRIMGENTWGYNDEEGNVVIPLGKYKFLNPIDEKGMILATKGKKHGYIDINENAIVPFQYDDISLFRNGLACVKQNKKFGFVNRKGKIVIPIQFDSNNNFEDSGLAIVEKNKKFGFIDKTGKEIIPVIFNDANQSTFDNLVVLCKNKKWAFYDNRGKQKTNFIYDEIALTSLEKDGMAGNTFWENGLILVKKNKQIAYLNKDLTQTISFGEYDTGERFNQNRIAIVSKNNKYGIINEFGKEVVKAEYDTIEHPEESYHESQIFAAKRNNYLVLLDQNGKKIYDQIKDFSFDYCRLNNKIEKIYHIQDLNGKYGAIDTKGKLIIPIVYKEFQDFKSNYNAIVNLNGKFGLINSNNEITYRIDNKAIYCDRRELDYYIIENKDSKFGIIDKNLKPIFNFDFQDLSPCYYDTKNRFIAKKNDKYGVIDRAGKIIIPFQYTTLSNWVEYGLGENFHFVVKNNKHGIINKDGKIVIPVIYDSLFYENDKTIILSKDEKYGIVTIQNKQIIPFVYDKIYTELSFFSEKKEPEYYVLKNGEYSIINNKNEIVKSSVSKAEVEEKFSYYN